MIHPLPGNRRYRIRRSGSRLGFGNRGCPLKAALSREERPHSQGPGLPGTRSVMEYSLVFNLLLVLLGPLSSILSSIAIFSKSRPSHALATVTTLAAMISPIHAKILNGKLSIRNDVPAQNHHRPGGFCSPPVASSPLFFNRLLGLKMAQQLPTYGVDCYPERGSRD